MASGGFNEPPVEPCWDTEHSTDGISDEQWDKELVWEFEPWLETDAAYDRGIRFLGEEGSAAINVET